MSAPPYMRLYWGDYSRKTRHLKTAADHGAYLLLIGALWDNGGKLPADDETLAAHALCTPEQWAEMKPRLLPFFDVRRGKISQARVTEELDRYKTTSGKRKVAGKTGGEARAEKQRGNRQAIATRLPPKSKSESKTPLAPQGAVSKMVWEGPEDIRRRLSVHGGDSWVLSRLARCRHELGPDGERLLITDSPWAMGELEGVCRSTLWAMRITAVLERPEPVAA